MSYQVFLSYSRKDSELARDLARRLEEVGAKVFTDSETVSPGEEWRQSISRALREADEVVLLLTDHVAPSSNVIFDLGLADALDKPVTPVVVNEGVERHLPMIGKRSIKYTDLPKFIGSLEKRVKAA